MYMAKIDNEVLKALRERRSCRCYKPEQITDEELQAVLEAGTYAPTGMGYQDPWIVAVQEPAIVAKLVEMNARVMGTTDNPYYGAPTIVLVFGSRLEKWRNSVCDGSLVLGNMMLAAHELGLASCWINRAKETFQRPEWQEWLTSIGVDAGRYEGIGHLALGYADGPLPPPLPRKPDRVVWVE